MYIFFPFIFFSAFRERERESSCTSHKEMLSSVVRPTCSRNLTLIRPIFAFPSTDSNCSSVSPSLKSLGISILFFMWYMWTTTLSLYAALLKRWCPALNLKRRIGIDYRVCMCIVYYSRHHIIFALKVIVQHLQKKPFSSSCQATEGRPKPMFLRFSRTLSSFKRRLKTYYFSLAFNRLNASFSQATDQPRTSEIFRISV